MIGRVFLDANVLLELLQHRRYYAEARKAIEEHDQNLLVASILSVDLVLYYVERDKSDKHAAFKFLSQYEILDMNQADYRWAQANDQGDFEDALQVACALRHGCSRLLTLDKLLAKRHRKHIVTVLIAG